MGDTELWISPRMIRYEEESEIKRSLRQEDGRTGGRGDGRMGERVRLRHVTDCCEYFDNALGSVTL